MPDDDADTQRSLARGPTGTMPVAVEPTGDDERYELGTELGRGGMGEVRLAHDTRIDREVAVKLLLAERRDSESIARFFREAHVQGRLDHPSIVPIHDLGVDRHGNPYFVMKRLSGTTLAAVLENRSKDPAVRSKWPRRQILSRFVDVCLAVEFAHTRGVVHRDLKPANIMLGDFGEVYVLDWGLARVLERGQSTRMAAVQPGADGDGQTKVGSMLGTPGYMPPEQIRNAAVDARADVYALGCILYEILTGQKALPSGLEGLDATLAAPCHRPSTLFPEIAIPELDDMCALATAAQPGARPSARAVADAIQAYLDGDHDLARRRDLAREHAAIAHDAFSEPGDVARARAMREAGRALVLDPGNVDAQGVLASLLLEAPNVVPREAHEEADRERAVTRQAMLQSVWRGFGILGLLTFAAFLFPVRYPSIIFTEIALLFGAGVLTFFASRRPLRMRHPIFLGFVAFNTAALTCGAVIFGPFLVMPVFLLGAMSNSLTPPFGFRWPVIVVPQMIGYMLPLALEWAGVLPSTYHIDHGLVLTPWVLEIAPRITGPLVLITTLMITILMTAMMSIQRKAQEAAQDRLHAQSWHLRQLLPRGSNDKRRPSTGPITERIRRR